MPPEANPRSFPVRTRVGGDTSSVDVFDRREKTRGHARNLRRRSGPPNRNAIRGPVETAS